MNSFFDELQRDLNEVFFGEFTKFHILAGVILKCTIIDYTAALTGRQSDDYAAVHGEHLQLAFRSKDFLRKRNHLPKEKERLQFDNRWYTVARSQDEFGCCRLTLESQRGRYAK